MTFRIVPAGGTQPDQHERRVYLTHGTAGRSGVRLWLSCPRCARRCSAVYVTRWDAHGNQREAALSGCRVCLGLTDTSRQQHKTLGWALAVLGRETPSMGGSYKCRSVGAMGRAADVFERRWARMMRVH
jgi:hypothetical protein